MDFFTFIHMSNADSSDSHKFSISCRMLNEGERNTMSSAYKNVSANIFRITKNTKCFKLYDNVIDKNREETGDMAPPCLTPALRAMKFDT